MFEKLELDATLNPDIFNLTNCAIIASNWEKYLEKLEKLPGSSQARIIGMSVLGGARETSGSIMQIVNNGLRIFNDPIIRNISCQNQINLNELITKPTIVFLIVPDETIERNAFVSMFISQLYKNTIQVVSKKADLKLERPMYFIFDEFANIPTIANMSQIITVSRSRNIFFLLVIQGLQQLVEKYGKETAETIFSNCTLHTFLQTMDYETAQRYSEIIGDKTVINYSFSKGGEKVSRGDNSSTSLQGKKLITAAELMKLEQNEAIIFMSKKQPARTTMIPFYE
jgi:type IV secretion system protein VirD4